MRKTINVKLTKSEIDHILTLIFENQREGWYYGRKDYWDKWNKNIKEKLESEAKSE